MSTEHGGWVPFIGACKTAPRFAPASTRRIALTIGTILLSSALGVRPLSADDQLPDWLKGVDLRATYGGGVALIYEHRCVSCHRPGEVAPMSFLTYADIRKWSGKTNTPLESLIQTRAMPPWPADPAVGEFSNSLYLTTREMDLLIEWIRLGLPRGEGTSKPARAWLEGWNIGKPDHIFDLPAVTLEPNAETQVVELTVETTFPEDRWIVAAEVRPGNDTFLARVDAGPLGSFHPGNGHVIHTAGTARLLKAREKVTVRLQYEKSPGAEASDQSRLGVVFAKDSRLPLRNVREVPMPSPPFTIPAGAANFEVRAQFRFPVDGQIVSLMPIMNLRGKNVRYEATMPDGTVTALLSIPEWDPNWKFRYQLKRPIKAPQGTLVEAIGHFDNSEGNIRNPDPTAVVNSGPGGEVLEGWIGYVQDE